MRLPLPAVDIDAVELVRVRLPLREPFVATHGIETARDVVLVHLFGAGGFEGWGECVALSRPTYTLETTDTAWVALRDTIVPGVLDDEAVDVSAWPMAAAALDAAVVDLAGRSSAEGVPDVWAGAPGTEHREQVPCGVVVGRADSIAALLDVVQGRVKQGYRQVKCKIGPGWDLDPLRAVRERWPDLALAADANGSYSRHDAHVLASLDELGLVYLEQPFAPHALEDHASLRQEISTPIALDESVCSLGDFERACDAGALGVLNLKPGRVGGTAHWCPIEQGLRSAGIPAFVGGMLETGVGRAYALRVASSDTFMLPTDLGPSARYFATDITDPITMSAGGMVQVPAGGGFAAVPIPERLEEFAVDRLVLEPRRRRARRAQGAPRSREAPSPWIWDDPHGSVEQLHQRDQLSPPARAVWHMTGTSAALVLGSTQDDSIVDRAACATATDGGVAIVRRHSGGGAVLVSPQSSVWIDVILPRGDPLWDDDVHRSFLWLGEAWARALRELALDARVHRGAMQRTRWSDVVCFAGLGPGEVTLDGRKVVGISQRRTRGAARFQCVVDLGVRPSSRIADLLVLDEAERGALRAHLEATTDTIPATMSDLVGALRDALAFV